MIVVLFELKNKLIFSFITNYYAKNVYKVATFFAIIPTVIWQKITQKV